MKTLTLTELLSRYSDPDKAREFLEKLRWPNGVKCPHCGLSESIHKLTGRADSKKPVRKGVYFCGKCRKQFTVTVGTIMEASHIPLAKWIAAFFLLAASKKSMSSLQLQRMLGVTYKSAWFMTHRIRHAMDAGPHQPKLSGKVEVDETYVGGRVHGQGVGRGVKNKSIVLALISRDGNAQATIVKDVKGPTLQTEIKKRVTPDSRILTDEYGSYNGIGAYFKGGHGVVRHAIKEYVRGDASTNSAESFFALFKRGIVGQFHHVSPQHIHRYVNEFAFRWNNRKVTDAERMNAAINMIEGKRLKYRD